MYLDRVDTFHSFRKVPRAVCQHCGWGDRQHLQAEQEIRKSIATGTRDFIIGNYIGRKNAYPFDGAMDDLKV